MKLVERYIVSIVLFVWSVITCSAGSHVKGARSASMGGANVVTTRDSEAQYENPAAFGFMDREPSDEDSTVLGDQIWGWNIINLNVGYTLSSGMGYYLDRLTDVDFEAFDSDGLDASKPESIQSMILIGTSLYGVAEQGNFMRIDAGFGTSFRSGNFAIGLNSYTEAALQVFELDTANLGITQTASQLATEINNIATADGFVGDGQLDTLSAAQSNSISQVINNDARALEYLDFKLTELKNSGTISDKDVGYAVDFITSIDPGNTNNLIDDANETALLVRGFGLVEIPVSYGMAFDENLSVGVTAKAMFGTVSGAKLWFFNDDATDEAIDLAKDHAEGSVNIGLDIGAMYRLPSFQFGAVAHNINRPTFDGFSEEVVLKNRDGVAVSTNTLAVSDVTIDPQITIGAAFTPSRRFMVECNYDLLQTGTLYNGYDLQYLSIGTELDLVAFALRGGLCRNVAESDSDWVFTAGVGCNVFGIRADLGGAYGLGDKVEFDGGHVPREARLFARVALDF